MISSRYPLSLLSVLLLSTFLEAGVGVSVGVRFGPPVYRPYYRPRVVYARTHYYVPTAPVIIQPAPVVAVPVVSAVPAPITTTAPVAVEAVPAGSVQPVSNAVPVVRAARPMNDTGEMERLNDPDPRIRVESIIFLGRNKDPRAVRPLCRSLVEDDSPAVREASARSLGLIGSPEGLPTLQRAASVDPDRDVRKSAGFAAEVIRANLRR